MTLSEHIQPITGQGALDAQAFGMRAAKLDMLAGAGVAIVPSLALSCALVARVEKEGPAVLDGVIAQIDAHFPKGAFLTLRGSAQNRSWGGPEAISLIGCGPDALPDTGDAAKDENLLLDFIGDFGAAVHDLDAELVHRADPGTPLLAAGLNAFEAHGGAPFPTSRADQLRALIGAFAQSWARPTTRILRQAQGAPEDAGLGVIVQLCWPGIDPDWFQDADEATGAPAWREADDARQVALLDVCDTARRILSDAARIEYVWWQDAPIVLDAVVAKRSRQAELQIVVDLAEQGILTRAEAILRIDPRSLSEHIHPQIAAGASRDVLGYGIAASPGAAQGPLVFSADAAQAADAQGKRAILVRAETSPEDIRGMNSAAGVLTLSGGLTSHAAVIAQGLGVPCVVGASRCQVNPDTKLFTAADGRTLREGDMVTLDGSAGTVLVGALPLQHSALSPAFGTLMTWADDTRKIGVRANADTLQEARTAKRFKADGIGLCRTEHMFYDHDRLTVMRELIVADDDITRRDALDRLLPMQRGDFEALFSIMEDSCVTIRLLDPPLHEFLPKEHDGVAELATATGLTEEVVTQRIAALEEFNPMLGKRGVRLAVTFPEIYEMQARAIFEAGNQVFADTGKDVTIEIMIPLVSAHREVELVNARISKIAEDVRSEAGRVPPYVVGVMVETPRAALRAGDLASASGFLSFGTNDLTQMTYGLSRDDAGRFMREYVNSGVYPEDPFLTLDVEGVGELLLTASQRGRAANPDIVLGLCGEHGGDPASVRFCRVAGFDYVSCSPYRVPIARLAAAQAELLA